MDARPLNTLKFHLERIARGAGDDHDWERVVACLESLTAAGGGPLRALLGEALDAARARRLPASYPVLARGLQSAIDAAAAAKPRAAAPADPVAEAAALVRGRALLVVGGIPRPEHIEALESAFELSECLWPATNENNPSAAFLEPYIKRPEVAAVVVLIRWVRHTMDDDVATLCERHAKPLVRVTGGYNPQQVAKALLEQSGKRL